MGMGVVCHNNLSNWYGCGAVICIHIALPLDEFRRLRIGEDFVLFVDFVSLLKLLCLRIVTLCSRWLYFTVLDMLYRSYEIFSLRQLAMFTN